MEQLCARYGLRFLLSFLLSLIAYLPATSQAGFCVQNFNLYGPLYATDVELRTYLTAKELLQKSEPCQIIHFQEVWNDSHIEYVETLFAKKYQISAPNKKYRIGLMSLYSNIPQSPQTYSFRVNNEGGILDSIRDMAGIHKAFHVNLVPTDEEPVLFLNTHLHPTSSAVRITQILDIYNWRQKNLQHKLIMTGDFNSAPGSIEYRLLQALGFVDGVRQGLGGTYPKNFCTYCSWNPRSWKFSDEVIDYIWISNKGGDLKRQLSVIRADRNLMGSPDFTFSDHFGVRTYIEWENASPSNCHSQNNLMSQLKEARNILESEDREEFQPYIRQLKRGQWPLCGI